MESDTYTDLLNRGYALLQQKNLPEKFVKLNTLLEEPYEKTNVTKYFLDINKQIDEYKEQFKIIVQELGTLAPTPTQKQETVYTFFLRLLDLFKLGRNTQEPIFHTLLEKYVEFLESGTLDLKDSTEKSLFDALVKSAWALTNKPFSIEQQVKQEGGRLKNKTRKHKRKTIH